MALFNDTVAASIAYGTAGLSSEDAIRSAAGKTHALELIQELPEGYHSDCGENGIRLSDGQRQRLAITRAHQGRTYPNPGRGDLIPGHGLGETGTARHRITAPGSHRTGDRPPPVDHRECRPNHCDAVGSDC